MLEQTNRANASEQSSNTSGHVVQDIESKSNQLDVSQQTVASLKILNLISSDIADISKNAAAIVSILSLVVGGCLSFLYFKVINAVYLLTSPVDLVFLMTITAIGFGLLVLALLFSFCVVPVSMMLTGGEFFKHNTVDSNDRLKFYTFLALLSPYITTSNYIILQGYFPIPKPYDLNWYIVFSVITYSYCSLKIFQSYHSLKLSGLRKHLAKWLPYVFMQTLMLFIGIFQVILLIKILSDSPYISYMSKNEDIVALIAIVLTGIIIFIQSAFISDKLCQHTDYKNQVKSIFISSVIIITFLLMLSFLFVVKSSVTVFGVKDKNDVSHVYRFDYKEIEAELPRIDFLSKKTLNNKADSSYKRDKNYLYLNYYAVVKFRDMLVLCPKNTVDLIIINDVIEQCIDLSDYKYKQVSYDFYSNQ